MRRYHSDTKDVGATFGGGHGTPIDIAAATVFVAFRENRDFGIFDSAIFTFAVIRFHSNVLRIDWTEVNARAHLKRFAHRNILPVLVSNLHIVNAHLRPFLPDPGLP